MTQTHPGPAIEAVGLKKSFGDVHALRGVDLTAEAGTVLGVLGPNGAGKTTVVRILTTLLAPDAGTARVAGIDVVKDPGPLRSKIGLAGQYAAVDENLTGAENLTMFGRLYGDKRPAAKKRAADLLERFRLEAAGDRLVRTYSGGMRRRLDLASALVTEPPVLFLDEPTTGLDPRSRLDLWETIEELVVGGTTVLLTTQYLDEADRLADDIAVIDQGQVIARGTADELKGKVGGDRLDVTFAEVAQAEAAVEPLGAIASETPSVHGTTVRVVLAERQGVVTRAVHALDAKGLEAEDLEIRRPTLDDVFLTLTGRSAVAAESETDGDDVSDDQDRSEVAA
ncbi:MAG: ATP-binding cassette domain-containing protein [Solirubrobacteraceae bacterium]|nr:ATP-binding cassette domain-containing protein [Solirubrobacteraceae bacterium]